MENVVVIGGGTGVAAILRGIKNIEGFNISAIITVADDGGSTGRLKTRYNIPAVGDIRNVLIALAESESLLSTLMDFRFYGDSSKSDDIAGHSLGNLILAALTQKTGNIMEAISQIGSVLRIKGSIIPSTTEVVELYAEMKDGTIVRGESNIPEVNNVINRVFYTSKVVATQEAVNAINEANYILLGIGSLYTSVLPNLIVSGISEAINNNKKAEVIYLCNIMTQPGETDNYDVDDHVNAIQQHMQGKIDALIFPNNYIPKPILNNYKLEKADVVKFDPYIKRDYKVYIEDLICFEDNQARHCSQKIEKVVRKYMKVVG